MSMVTELQAEPRSSVGTGSSRELRRDNRLPGVIYGGSGEAISISINHRDIEKELQNPSFYTHIFNIDVAGKKHRVLPKEIQIHPVTDNPLHVDFMRVDEKTKISVSVPVVFKNEEKSPGLKKGGMLNVVSHSLPVKCLASNIPEAITIDLGAMQVGTSLRIREVELPKGVTYAGNDAAQTLMTIVPPKVKGSHKNAGGDASGADEA